MHQPHSNQQSCSLWTFVMGFVSVVLVLGAGATLTHAAKPIPINITEVVAVVDAYT